MQAQDLDQIDPSIMAEVESQLGAQLEEVHARMEDLTRRHQRGLFLKQIYTLDPLTRERFTTLQADVEQYPGKMAELREEERLLTRWLDRSRQLRLQAKRAIGTR